MSWVLQLEKVPSRNMRQMRDWFHWQITRVNAVFSEGVGGGDEELEASSATLEAGASHSWAASWRPAREVFASLFWDDHAFGGFTTDLCWSGGTDALKPYLGASVRGQLSRWYEYQGKRLWVQPRESEASEVLQQVQQLWEDVGQQMAASIMLTARTAVKVDMSAREGWSLQHSYHAGMPIVRDGVLTSSVEEVQVWSLKGVLPAMVVPGVLPMEVALELEEADKKAAQPKSAEEAEARERLKRTPIHISVAALRRHGFPEYMVQWFEHGVRLGLHQEFDKRYEKVYPMHGDAERQAAIKECNRMVDMLVLEEVENDTLEEATVVSPWVIILKGDKTRVCCDVLVNEMMRPPRLRCHASETV